MFEEGFTRGKAGDLPGAAECFRGFVTKQPDALRGWTIYAEVRAWTTFPQPHAEALSQNLECSVQVLARNKNHPEALKAAEVSPPLPPPEHCRPKQHSKAALSAFRSVPQRARALDPSSAEAVFLYASAKVRPETFLYINDENASWASRGAQLALHEYHAAQEAFDEALAIDPAHVGRCVERPVLIRKAAPPSY